jgi:hypothetical protein
MNQKHFNWFYKLMWRIILGIKIEDIKEERWRLLLHQLYLIYLINFI